MEATFRVILFTMNLCTDVVGKKKKHRMCCPLYFGKAQDRSKSIKWPGARVAVWRGWNCGRENRGSGGREGVVVTEATLGGRMEGGSDVREDDRGRGRRRRREN